MPSPSSSARCDTGGREDEQAVRMVLQQTRRDDALVNEREPVFRQPGIENLEFAVCAASGKQRGVVGQDRCSRFRPFAPGRGLINPVVVQRAPEEFLQRLRAIEVLQT